MVLESDWTAVVSERLVALVAYRLWWQHFGTGTLVNVSVIEVPRADRGDCRAVRRLEKLCGVLADKPLGFQFCAIRFAFIRPM